MSDKNIAFDVNVLGKLGEHIGNHIKHKYSLQTQVYQFLFPGTSMALSSGAGQLDRPDIFGPVHGWMMEVQRLTITGYSAGTVQPNMDNGEPITFSPPGTAAGGAGTQYFGKGDLVIPSGSHLIFNATGITGVVTIYGAATMFPFDYYPYYVS